MPYICLMIPRFDQTRVVVKGMRFPEGPAAAVRRIDGAAVWEGSIYIVDKEQPEGIIWEAVRGQDGVWRNRPWAALGAPGNNGSAIGADGWLYVANPLQRSIFRVRREEGPARVEALITPDTFALNAPNDLVVTPNGDLFFTDPSKEREERGALRLRRANGEIVTLLDRLVNANGLAFAPDGSTLYVSLSVKNEIISFRLRSDGTLARSRMLARFDPPAEPDGMCVGADGTIYQALFEARAVAAVSPDGRELWRAACDQDMAAGEGGNVTNCTLAPDGLYVTRTSTDAAPANGALLHIPLQ